MTTILQVILGAGLLFPAISMLTAILSAWTFWRERRHASPVFIPLIGPVLLTIWVMLADAWPWLIPIFWGADIGTVVFLAVLPRLVREWWQTSYFTKRITLVGSRDIESATLTLHSGGHYHLQKSWSRPAASTGIVGLGETGKYVEIENGFELTAHHGLRRVLRLSKQEAYESTYLVEEDTWPQDDGYSSLGGWMLSTYDAKPEGIQ